MNENKSPPNTRFNNRILERILSLVAVVGISTGGLIGIKKERETQNIKADALAMLDSLASNNETSISLTDDQVETLKEAINPTGNAKRKFVDRVLNTSAIDSQHR